MKEQGVIIFRDGTKTSFGTHVCTDEEGYLDLPSHEESFQKEVLNNINFLMSGLVYDKNLTFYANAMHFSLAGIMIVINNQLTLNSETKVLSYMPIEPTKEQLQTLHEDQNLQNIQIQDVYEFQSFDWDDYLEYSDFNQYIQSKANQMIL